MTGHWRAAAVLACAVLAAGCAVTTSHPAASAAAPTVPSPTTALTAQGVTWAAVPMGAPSGENLFWQLFVLPAGSTRWSLVTPPDVPTNGALILAAGGGTLTTGVRPALALRFSPVTTTRDDGHSWAAGPPAAGLAEVPDALASAPGGQLIALTQDGQASLAASVDAAWSALASRRTLAAAPAAAGCGLTALTAVAYSPAGAPILAGNCARPGTAGIFSYANGTWHATAPAMPASFSRQPVRVLRLTRTGSRDTALLAAGTGTAAILLAAWTSGSGGQWTVSPPLRLSGQQVMSASFGDGGSAAVVLSGNHGLAIAGPGAPWRSLPALPPGRTVTLALPAAGGTDALAANGGTLTAWHLGPGSAQWARTQVAKIPIQYDSSA